MMSSFLSLLDALLKSFLSVMGSIWSVDSLGNSSLSSKFLQYFSKFWCIQFSVSGRYERRSVHWCISGFYYASWAADCYHTGSVLTVLYGNVLILFVKSFHIKEFLTFYLVKLWIKTNPQGFVKVGGWSNAWKIYEDWGRIKLHDL